MWLCVVGCGCGCVLGGARGAEGAANRQVCARGAPGWRLRCTRALRAAGRPRARPPAADPHPGNLLKVTEGAAAGKLALLDFGLVAEIPEVCGVCGGGGV